MRLALIVLAAFLLAGCVGPDTCDLPEDYAIEGFYVTEWEDTVEDDGRPAEGIFLFAVDFEDAEPCAANSELNITGSEYGTTVRNRSASHMSQGLEYTDTGSIRFGRTHFDRDAFEGERMLLEGEDQHSSVTFSTPDQFGELWISFSGVYKPEEDVITGIVSCNPAHPVCDDVLLDLEATSDPPFDVDLNNP